MASELLDFLNLYILEGFYRKAPITYIWGCKGCGKSYTIHHCIKHYKKILAWCYIRCAEIIDIHAIYSYIFEEIYHYVSKNNSQISSSYYNSTAIIIKDFQQMIDYIQSIVLENFNGDIILVLDDIEQIDQQYRDKILDGLVTLANTISNFCVILIGNRPIDQYYNGNLFFNPIQFYVHPYNEATIYSIICDIARKKLSDDNFINIIHDMCKFLLKLVLPITQNMDIVIKILERLFSTKNFIDSIKQKLQSTMRNEVVNLLRQLGYLDNIQINNDKVFESNEEDDQPETMINKENQSISYYFSINEMYLIISAFIATFLKQSMDKVLFNNNKPLKLSKRRKNIRKKQLIDLQHKEIITMGWFTYERWEEIYNCIASTNRSFFSITELQNISKLIESNIVQKNPQKYKYKCIVEKDFVVKLCSIVQFPIQHYVNINNILIN